jgi:WD40 repeat protein
VAALAAEQERLEKEKAEQEELRRQEAEQKLLAAAKIAESSRAYQEQLAREREEQKRLAHERVKTQQAGVMQTRTAGKRKRTSLLKAWLWFLGVLPRFLIFSLIESPRRTFLIFFLTIAAGSAAWVFWPRGGQKPASTVQQSVVTPKSDLSAKPPAKEPALASMRYAIERTLGGHTSEVMQVSFSPNGQILASAGRDSKVNLWDVDSGNLRWILSVPDAQTAVFRPDGHMLAAAGESGGIHLFDIPAGNPAGVLGNPSADSVPLSDGSSTTERIYTVDFSPDGRFLAAAEVSGLRVYENSALVRGPDVSAPLVVKFSPDGRWLASAGNAFGKSGPIALWRVATWLPHHTLKPAFSPGALAFSPDGKLLASGGEDKTVTIWEVSSGQQVRTLAGVGGKVRSLAFRPDGRELACSASGTVVLWDTSTWSEVQRLAHDAPAGSSGKGVNSVAFSPDGRLLATGGQDLVRVRLWRAE